MEYASGCSGSDIAFICLEIYLHFISKLLALPMRAVHTFCCDKDASKQKFLKTNFKPMRFFGDVADLGRRMATDILTGEELRAMVCSVYCRIQLQKPHLGVFEGSQ